MAEENVKQESAAEGETAAPLEAVMKEQIDKEVDAAFPAAPASAAGAASAGQAATHALGPEDDAASDAEAQKVLLDEVAAQETTMSVAPKSEAAAPPPAAPEPSADDSLAAGRAASAEAVSAAEREGLIEQPVEAEAKPAPKAKDRAEKYAAKADPAPAAEKKVSPVAAVLHKAGSLVATILELADRPFAWVEPEVRNVLGVAGLVILGVSAALIVLRLKSLL
jgi:hypothetical protein